MMILFMMILFMMILFMMILFMMIMMIMLIMHVYGHEQKQKKESIYTIITSNNYTCTS